MSIILFVISLLCTFIWSESAIPKEIVVSCGSVGKELELCRSAAQSWGVKSGNQVKIVSAAQGSGDRLAQYQLLLASKASDIDVFIIDTTWPGIIGSFFLDFKKAINQDNAKVFFNSFIENNTIQNQLIAIPWFIDAGLLYYRKDLLEKYQMKVPETWEELTETAFKIQNSERKQGNREIWGYVFQGRAYEGLTCNALEWIASSNGGAFVDDKGKVTINNPNAIHALQLASTWIGKISPKGVLNYMEEETRAVFQAGGAVFMRNWPYAWRLANAPDSPIRGKVGIVPLPKGSSGGVHVGALGGWSLAVSKYSKNPNEAKSLVLYLSAREEQKKRALEAGLSPTLLELYQDKELQEAIPDLNTLQKIFQSSVPRPANIMRTRYNKASSEIWNSVYQILAKDGDVKKNISKLEKALNRISHGGQW